MQRIVSGWLIINPVEDRRVVALVVKGSELRAVQETARTAGVHRQKVAEFARAHSKCGIFAVSAERAVHRVQRELRLLSEPATSDGIDDQACFVSVLGVRGAADQLKRLKR